MYGPANRFRRFVEMSFVHLASALEVRNGPNIAVEFHLAGKTLKTE